MQPSTKRSLALVAATLLVSASAHSWIEDMSVIAKNGTFIGAPGYPRANAKRGPGVNPDKEMVHLIPANGRPTGNKILDSDPMCMPSQQQPKQSEGSPMLNAAPGDMVALRYQENGHVSLPENQPGKEANRGTVYIYGTTSPSPEDKFLSIHKVWNSEGTGGDKRGKLLASEPYDDGQCYQINGGQISTQRREEFKHESDPLMGADLWCQNNFKIPKDAPSGKPYTVYWVWEWDTAPTAGQPNGLLERYTTCMDISLSKTGNTQSNVDSSAAQYAQGQSLNQAAIPKYVKQLNAGDDIFVSGSVRGEASAPDPASSAALPAPSKPVASTVAVLPVPESSKPAAATQATVTVTAPAAPAREKTVTVTAPVQTADSPSTTKITTHPTIYVTMSSGMQTQVAPTGAAGSMSAAAQPVASSVPAAGATPVTVSGVVIPTMSGSRFTGTASAVSPAQTGSPAANRKRCESCKPAKRSVILGDGAEVSKHAAKHVTRRSLKHAGSAKFRL
ncbi:MAG: hypothetical protein L6R35_006926 [Caloplaca aegaea]|nr:MAG: hypothetical protein L6R35_006926 [Caloplaca aegaea]